MMRQNRLFAIMVLFFIVNTTNLFADEFSTSSPAMLNLILYQDEMVTRQVSLTVHPFCIQPFDIDVIASDPNALVMNTTGVLTNGCGGETSTFDIKFTGSGATQIFRLKFEDLNGSIMASIPVTINTPEPAREALLGLLMGRRAIGFQVSSNGCTTKSNFKVQVTTPLKPNPHSHQLTLIRLKEDPCDAVVPLGTLVRFAYRELGLRPGDQLQVKNPLGTAQVPWPLLQ